MPRSAPMAIAVRKVSWHCGTPIDTATISVTTPASFMRTACSTAISQNGFIAIFTFAVSTPVPSDLTRTFTYGSITRLTVTRHFIDISEFGEKGLHSTARWRQEKRSARGGAGVEDYNDFFRR